MAHALLERARSEGTPLIDPGPGGDITVTFVREARRPPRVSGDFDDWAGDHGQAEPNMAEAAPGVWTFTRTFPRSVYMEYAFFAGGRRLMDGFNTRSSPNGIGARNNWFYGPDAGPSPLLRPAPAGARGAITRLRIEADEVLVGGARDLFVYRPAVAGPYPLIVVMDGRDYYRRGKLPTLVDNLIAQKRICPVALAMIDCSRGARYIEYACSDATVMLFTDVILPRVAADLPLANAPGAHAIMGASMGGVMALYTALRAPEVFGRVLSQSGAFEASQRRGQPNDLVATDLVRHLPRAPLNIWMDVGRFEGLLESNRRMSALLRERGYPVAYREYEGGHNVPSWRDDVAGGLEALFPPAA